MKHPPLLIIDTETLGLDDAPVWEVAAIRVDEDGQVADKYQAFVQHGDPSPWIDDLPASFSNDYENRYDSSIAVYPESVVLQIDKMAAGKALVLGSNPAFDMQRIETMARNAEMPIPGYHYHPEDIPTLARGWLYGRGVYPAPPWKSDFISQVCGVDPRDFDRHTAMGDCEWTLALWRAVSS